MSSLLSLQQITRSFPQPEGQLEVLKGVNLEIAAGEMVALLGSSGSGKTTLLQIAGLLAHPTSGTVLLDGQDVTKASDAELTALRRDTLGFVYQFHQLLPEFTAEENIILPQMIAGESETDSRKEALVLLSEIGLKERASHYPNALSGGEQQRVAIARALANQPRLLLADEPTGNLDQHSADTVFELLVEQVRNKGMGALIVTHNEQLAKRMHRVLRLENGRIAA